MKALIPTPEEYRQPLEQAGKVVRVDYRTNDGGEPLDKYAYVYLPYGYDESKQYDILYCLHGGGGEIEVYFGTDENPADCKKMLDYMIAVGRIDPIIAVSPTYYKPNSVKGMASVMKDINDFVHGELIDDLIPAVEGRFRTYAETTDHAGIQASRDHRGFTGYSMGGCCTWYTFAYALEYFRYFMPQSGDWWGLDGTSDIDEAIAAVEAAVARTGLRPDDFFVYAITGDKDIVYRKLKALSEALGERAPSFRMMTEEQPEGNLCFRAEPEATHDYIYMPLYFYNALPTFWKGGPVF